MSATYVPHLKLSYGGRLGGTPEEIWSNTLRFNLPNPTPNRAQLQAALVDAVPALQAWISNVDSYISKAAEMNYAKLNWILPDGKQRDADTVVYDFQQPARGFIAGNQPPFFQTAAVTFRTNVKRGRAHSGRVFPPMVTFTPDAQYSPYFSEANANAMANSFRTMVDGVADAIGASFGSFGGLRPDLAVFSPGNTIGPVAPLMQLVTGFVVDRVPDVQHRRTNRIPRAEGATVPING